jgi:hypothetical protein
MRLEKNELLLDVSSDFHCIELEDVESHGLAEWSMWKLEY